MTPFSRSFLCFVHRVSPALPTTSQQLGEVAGSHVTKPDAKDKDLFHSTDICPPSCQTACCRLCIFSHSSLTKLNTPPRCLSTIAFSVGLNSIIMPACINSNLSFSVASKGKAGCPVPCPNN